MPQDVCFNDLKFIIEFVYRGEIDVSQAELQVSAQKNKVDLSPRSSTGDATRRHDDFSLDALLETRIPS